MKMCYSCFNEEQDNSVRCSHCGSPLGIKNEEGFPNALPRGSILKGRYILGRVLGQGGFGITYLAKDYLTDSLVAIKEYFPSVMATRKSDYSVAAFNVRQNGTFTSGKDDFQQEAQTLAKFRGHPNIVRVFDCFEENNTAYLVMEYISGESLEKYLARKGGRISWEEAERILLPLLEALKDVHAIGIVHRDIAPDNIIVTADQGVKLLDFGAARDSIGERTKSLDVVLKHGYAPFEQYMYRSRLGSWTDVYAMAATLYRTITGVTPPDSADRFASLPEDSIKSPSSLGVSIPEKAEKALMKALAVRAEDRTRSMEEFKKDLEAAAVQPPRQGFPWKKILAAVCAVAAIVCAVSAVIILPGPLKPTPKNLKEDVFDKVDKDDNYDLESAKEYSAFGSRYKRNEIIAVTFLSNTKGKTEDSWDVSAEHDGTVQAWVKEEGGFYHLYIGADGGIVAPEDLEGLFEGYSNLQIIEWNDAVDMKNVKKMKTMFFGCAKLEELDFSPFKYSRPTTFRFMLKGCEALTSDKLTNLADLNTVDVDDMAGMFKDCSGIKSLDLSGFDTSKVKYMGQMFRRCSGLEKLNIEGFDLTSVKKTERMFSGCSKLESITIKSSVNLGKEMFSDCKKLKELRIEGSALSFGEEILKGCELSVYYPADDSSWEEALNNMYGAESITWVAVGKDGSEVKTQESYTIEIPDQNLKNAIQKKLGIEGREITSLDASNLTELSYKGWEKNDKNEVTINLTDDEKIKDLRGISEFKNLKTLYLDYNLIEDMSPVTQLKELEYLRVRGNKIKVLPSLQEMENLKSLYIEYNEIEDISALEGMTGLVELGLISNPIKDISCLKNLTDLTLLWLCEIQLKDEDIKALEGLNKLVKLHLHDNGIKDISPLKGMESLEYLQIKNNSIEDISVLDNCKNLVELDISGNPIKEEDLEKFQKNHPDLKITK